MAKAERMGTHARKSYSKRMSDHVAYALVFYTLMLIFAVTPTMKSEGTSIFPYFLLVAFVAAVIPAAHGLEKKWQALSAEDRGDGSLDARFTADRIKLWVAAVGIPCLIAGVSLGFSAAL
jgi:hypothetical protein